MNARDWRQVLAGAGVGIAVTVFVALAWEPLYAKHPWPGYERAAAGGRVPHQFNSSPVARNHAMSIFAVSGLIVGLVIFPNRKGLLFAWAGLSAGLIICFAASPTAWESNLAPLAVILFPVEALPFLFAGFVGYIARLVVRSSPFNIVRKSLSILLFAVADTSATVTDLYEPASLVARTIIA